MVQRIKEGITTSTDNKKALTDCGTNAQNVKKLLQQKKIIKQIYIDRIKCNYHSRIGSNEYFEILFDKNKYTELDANIKSKDPLKFKDKSPTTKE